MTECSKVGFRDFLLNHDFRLSLEVKIDIFYSILFMIKSFARFQGVSLKANILNDALSYQWIKERLAFIG